MIDSLGLPVLDAGEVVECAVLPWCGVGLIQAGCAKLGGPAMAAVVAFAGIAGMAGAPMSNII
jgi:hypothetical protein